MGKGSGFCGSFCTCIYNVIRSVPYMSIFGAGLFAVGMILSVVNTEMTFQGLAQSGFDLTAFQGFVVGGMIVVAGVNALVLIVSFFTTGWCMQQCCHHDKADGCCKRCCQSLFGVVAQYAFFLLCAVSLIIFFIMTTVGLTASILAVLNKSACDSDAMVIFNPKVADVGAAKKRQYAAGSWIQMIGNMPLDSIPLLAKADDTSADPDALTFTAAATNWKMAVQLGTKMCCGNDVDTASAITPACAVGQCLGLDMADDTECGAIVMDATLYPDFVAMKSGFAAECKENPKCKMKNGFVSQFMRAAFSMFAGMALCMFGQIVQLLHVQKTIVEVHAEQEINGQGGSGDDMSHQAVPLKYTA